MTASDDGSRPMRAVDWRDFAELEGVSTSPKPITPAIKIVNAANVNVDLFIKNTPVCKITSILTITDARKFVNSLP